MKWRALARFVVLLAPICGVLPACGGSPNPEPKVAQRSVPIETTPAPPPPKPVHHAPKAPIALEEYYKIRRMPAFSRSSLALASFSFDEKLIAYASDEGGRIDVWVKPIEEAKDGKLAAPKQLTHVEGFVHSFAFSPKEDLLVFEADRGGDELPRLYATDSKGTAPRELTAELAAGRRTQFVEWADDGKTFLYLSNGRDEKHLDLVEYDVKAKKSTILWEASGKLGFATTNREHNRFALIETHSDANTDVWLLDRKGKTPTKLTEHTGDIKFESETFARDGKSLYLTSDESGEFLALYALDLASKKRQSVVSDSWDVEQAAYSNAGKYFLTSTNEDGTPKLAVTEQATKKPVTLPAAPGKGRFVPLAFSRSDRYLAASLTSDEAPSTTYIIDMKAMTAKVLADPLPESLKGRSMVAGESVKIPSFDGRSVQAFLYRPAGDGPHPAIIDVHGGPTAQSRRTFAAHRQYFVSKGYAVLVPNVRGSTGYGKTYTKLDNLDLGGGPLKDVVACKKWLAANAKVAPDKVVVMGGSYGGYMALVAEAFTPDEFAANVDFFGVSDLKTLVESFPPYWAAFASYIYEKFGDPKNPAHAKYQHDRSPAHFVAQMKRPLLVVQGDKDARVKKDQSDRIVEELKRRNVSVHYLILENEGHGFTKTENNIKAYSMTDRFLDRYVFEDESVNP